MSAADWPTIAQRVAAARKAAGATVADAARLVDAEPAEIEAFERGEPVLAVYDLYVLAQAWGASFLTWFARTGHATRLEWIFQPDQPARVRSFCDCGWTTKPLDDPAPARQLAADHLTGVSRAPRAEHPPRTPPEPL